MSNVGICVGAGVSTLGAPVGTGVGSPIVGFSVGALVGDAEEAQRVL
jgi:hypothetical protein